MVELFRPEAQAGPALLENLGIKYTDAVTARSSQFAGYFKENRPSLPSSGAKDVWADINGDQSIKPPRKDMRISRGTTTETRDGHLIRNYISGLKVDEYFGEDGYEKTVWNPDHSWTRIQRDWRHGKELYEQHDASGVFKSTETRSSLTTSLHDPHGKLLYEVRRNKINGDTTLTEPGPDGRLVTKRYRLA
jgi:hypothetical protein